MKDDDKEGLEVSESTKILAAVIIVGYIAFAISRFVSIFK